MKDGAEIFNHWSSNMRSKCFILFLTAIFFLNFKNFQKKKKTPLILPMHFTDQVNHFSVLVVFFLTTFIYLFTNFIYIFYHFIFLLFINTYIYVYLLLSLLFKSTARRIFIFSWTQLHTQSKFILLGRI